jgi:PHD/YefM family antitoxin component YafN of YafNO toxin-antitoxin module
MTKRLTLRESHPPYTLSIEEEDVLGQEPVILERDGQPVTAIVSLAEYEAFRVWQETRDRERPGQADLEVLEREREAYEQLEPELLPLYKGQFVAIREGQVIDSDPDEMALVQRVYEKFGYGPMYVRKVGALLPVSRISSPTDEILRLAAEVYEGLSPDDVDQIEHLALDRSHFFVRRE